MPKIRPIIKPPREGQNVTLSDARAAFRALKREPSPPKRVLPGTKMRRPLSAHTIVVAEMVGQKVLVFTGRHFVPMRISVKMVGHKLGEFASKRMNKKARLASTEQSARRAG
jgi:ribosomal protein S19